MYILVVDDQHLTSELVQFVLRQQGYDVETTDNPRGAMQMIQKKEPDLLLLDVGMPTMNGFEFSQQLRSEGYEIPLIFVTARDSLEDKIQGFHIGADDYICKPFDHQELVVRVQAVLRRGQKPGKVVSNEVIRVGRFELWPADMKVIISGRAPIILTPTEMKVLRVLMSAPGQIVQREQLLHSVWNEDANSSNIVDVYVRRLRLRLELDPDRPQYIISIRGIGYKFIGK